MTKGKLPLILSATALLVAIFGSAGPAIAHGVQHALFAHNADKVDGKHAVAASASASKRAGKLVAANSLGRLPDSERIDGLDSTSLQRRVASVCALGSSVRSVGADGTVECETDDNTTYTAGEALSLSGGQFSLSTSGCQDGDVWKRAAGAWACDPDANTTYTASGALTQDGDDFRLSVAGCGTGEGWEWTGSDWSCDPDNDTTYSAGDGLALSGGQFGLSSGGCSAGEIWKWDGLAWSCVPDSDTTYAASGAISQVGNEFRLSTTGCAANEVWKYDGTAWSCEPDAGTTYTAGDGISISGTTIALSGAGCLSGEGWEWTGSEWSCDPDNDSLSALVCSDGQIAKYSSGTWACADDDDHVGDGSTITTNVDGTLSVGTIASTEISDEPAVKASSSGSGNVTSSASAKATVTATAPGAGYLLIVCQAAFNAPALTAPASISAELKDGSTSVETWTWDPGDADGALDLEQTHTSLVTLSGAGSHTYELWLSAASGTTPFDKARVVVQYFPTSL